MADSIESEFIEAIRAALEGKGYLVFDNIRAYHDGVRTKSRTYVQIARSWTRTMDEITVDCIQGDYSYLIRYHQASAQVVNTAGEATTFDDNCQNIEAAISQVKTSGLFTRPNMVIEEATTSSLRGLVRDWTLYGTVSSSQDRGLSVITPPSIDVPPVISPDPAVAGATLTISGFSVSGNPTPTESFKWFTDSGTGGALVEIPGEVSQNYTTDPANIGWRYQGQLIASNGVGLPASEFTQVVELVVAPSSTIDFVFDTTIPGGSGVGNLVLPMSAGKTVDWGDGTVNTLNTHTYLTPTTNHEVKIFDSVSDFRYNDGGDCKKLISISCAVHQFFTINSSGTFFGCENAVSFDIANPMTTGFNLASTFRQCSSATTINTSTWDTALIQNFAGMFFDCFLANPPVGNFDMGLADNINNMFRNCISATPDTSTWNTPLLARATNAFDGATLANPVISGWSYGAFINGINMLKNTSVSQSNYDDFLIAIDGAAVQTGVSFHAGNAQYTAGGAAEAGRNYLIFAGWTLIDGGPA